MDRFLKNHSPGLTCHNLKLKLYQSDFFFLSRIGPASIIIFLKLLIYLRCFSLVDNLRSSELVLSWQVTRYVINFHSEEVETTDLR